jgi:hypothetical protein
LINKTPIGLLYFLVYVTVSDSSQEKKLICLLLFPNKITTQYIHFFAKKLSYVQFSIIPQVSATSSHLFHFITIHIFFNLILFFWYWGSNPGPCALSTVFLTILFCHVPGFKKYWKFSVEILYRKGYRPNVIKTKWPK